MKKILFLDVTQPSTNIVLPKGFAEDGRPKSAVIVFWDIEGVPFTYDATNTYIIKPLYIQLEFRQSLKTESLGNSNNVNMIPVPLLRVGGWAPSSEPLPVPFLQSSSSMGNTFQLNLWGEGVSPSPLQFYRAVFWIVLDF